MTLCIAHRPEIGLLKLISQPARLQEIVKQNSIFVRSYSVDELLDSLPSHNTMTAGHLLYRTHSRFLGKKMNNLFLGPERDHQGLHVSLIMSSRGTVVRRGVGCDSK